MHILVTGGAGFIGSQVVDQLVGDGHEVRVLDLLLASAHSRTPDYLNPSAEFIRGDVGDPATVREALVGVDAVSHQAAMVGLGLDLSDAADYVRHNDLGTAVLLRELAARRFTGRLALASSMVVYGEGRYVCRAHGDVTPGPRRVDDLDAGRFDPGCPHCGAALAPASIDEHGRLDPRNVYAATKLHQEHLCFAFARETGASVIALRYHNVYGPRMPRDTPYAGVASIFASSLAAGEAPRVFEDGGQLRDFVHVRDVARANVIALSAPDATAGAYNVASGTPQSVLMMATAMAAAYGADAPAPIVTGQYRLGDVRHVFASAARARDALGFDAREDFAAGIAQFARSPLGGGVNGAALLVIAKDPRPGRCKTRLCPPCRPEQAARLATAALSDTLEVIQATPVGRRVLVLEGDGERWRRPGLEIIRQRGDGLAQRLANAFADVDQPALLVGMDTPQLTAALLADGLAALARHDAVLGPALDGGYWSIGLRSADAAVFSGVPMSSHETWTCQQRRLVELGLSTYEQPTLRDVDTIADARTVAALAPNSRFARTLDAMW